MSDKKVESPRETAPVEDALRNGEWHFLAMRNPDHPIVRAMNFAFAGSLKDGLEMGMLAPDLREAYLFLFRHAPALALDPIIIANFMKDTRERSVRCLNFKLATDLVEANEKLVRSAFDNRSYLSHEEINERVALTSSMTVSRAHPSL
jgi:hypothetical protein